MSKRDFVDDDNDDGPSSKMRKIEDADDGGGSGRSGRVRKKSAKVLEMEEFEQAEKVSTVTKKSKTPKLAQVIGSDGDLSDTAVPVKKAKGTPPAVGASIEATPTSRKSKKNTDAAASKSRSVPAELTPRTPSSMMIPAITAPVLVQQQEIKQEAQPAQSLLSSVLSKPPVSVNQEIKSEDPKSVIKYLLTSPVAGTQHSPAAVIAANMEPQSTPTPVVPIKKSSKKIKFEDGTSAPPSKKKEKKMKIEIMSPSEIGPPVSAAPPPPPPVDQKAPSLKMKIMSGSNPMTAQVAMETQENNASPAPKVKKSSKKAKQLVDTGVKQEFASPEDIDKAPKKKKPSKKKEKLIQNAISAAQQMPNLAALVTTPQSQVLGLGQSPSPTATTSKPSKKKAKSSAPSVKREMNTSDSLVMDFDENMEDEGEESNLVIAETEKQKKKKSSTKKKSPKEKEDQSSPKTEKAKKIPKRAPTAYMLFCNSHRPAIVAENPGIEFAGISRKLGELWQTQSNKQKLQWRRKAQRRMKKSNLISTGKVVGGKESLGGPSTSTPTPAVASQGGAVGPLSSTNKKLALMLQKSKPVVVEEGPLSPAKVGIDSGAVEHDDSDDSYNFSIEPLDVAAHLKLLGESLSIIGMRLQEHKGMIAVQGSLSVLLDSLLCACGPLLCLTQQVPGMDGCSPVVHAQTLDSVAYVMPGL